MKTAKRIAFVVCYLAPLGLFPLLPEQGQFILLISVIPVWSPMMLVLFGRRWL